MNGSPPHCILWTSPIAKIKAEILAERFGFSLKEDQRTPWPHFPDYQLCFTETPFLHLEVQTRTEQGKSVLFTEFVKGRVGYRRRVGGGLKQTLAKAIGIKSRQQGKQVLDATGGLGVDAFVMAYLGCRVKIIERSPVMAALLEEGLARAREIPELRPIVHAGMTLVCEDAIQGLTQLSAVDAPEVIYLDPMFPLRKKSSLNKIELRIIRAIVGQDEDAEMLLKRALTVAKERVVVKRPNDAPCIANLEPTMMVASKKNRYDIYRTGGNFKVNE